MSAPARQDNAGRPGQSRRSWSRARHFDRPIDGARPLAAVYAGGQRRDRTGTLTRAVDRTRDVALTQPDGARILPVAPELADLLPWPGGMRRGTTVAAVSSTSLLFTLIADGIANGAWAAVVGMPGLGVAAAAEYGIDLTRLALVPAPGDQWPTIVGALLDGLDIVVVATPDDVPVTAARTLMARARQRGCVLVPTREWPGCDLTLQLVDRRWRGLAQGRGRLRVQEVTLSATGRGRADRLRWTSTTMPPPSIAARVGPLPGQVPGLPVHLRPVDPPPAANGALPRRPRPVPACPPEPWREMFRQGQPAGTPGRPPPAAAADGAGYPVRDSAAG